MTLQALLSTILSTQPANYSAIPEANFGSNSTEKSFTIQWLNFLNKNREDIIKFHKDSQVKKDISQHLQKYSFLGGSSEPTFVDLVLYSLTVDKVKSTYQVDRLDKFGAPFLRWFNFLHASIESSVSVSPMFRC